MRHRPQPPRHLPRLLQPERRERAVLLALHPALEVPLGFAVTDEEDLRTVAPHPDPLPARRARQRFFCSLVTLHSSLVDLQEKRRGPKAAPLV
jgi:hypothetical protein